MKQAMKNIGLEREDLDTKKTKEDFTYSNKIAGQVMSAAEYDDGVVELRFRHYQQRLMDRINQVVAERKTIKNRGMAKDANSRFGSKSQSLSTLPTIKHKRQDASSNLLIQNQSEVFGTSPQASMYNNSKAMIISTSNSVTHIKDDFMNVALNRVKDSQKKQMKVIQASLKRAEKNNIR